ncbi:MAG TPA: hypothetical protein VGP08_14275 [Pyrinomonadaceae bacterium]|jgi:tetratricopeptide (TPR) repeat protein|nr:hypothetical protein [Pyrinomonadaceae bacterium]
MNFRPATCPNCGGNLQLPDDRATVNCMYCGTSIVVREAVQAAAAGNVGNWLKLADTAVASGNFQEAFDYYTRVLEVDASHSESWYGKGRAAGSLSSPQQFRITEMLACFRAALEHAPEGERREVMSKNAATAASGLADRAYRASYQQICAHAAYDAAWAAHLEQSRAVIGALEFAHGLDVETRAPIDQIVRISKHLREGVTFHVPGQLDYRNQPLTRRREVAGEYLAWLKKLEAFYGPKLRAMTAASTETHAPAFEQYETKAVRSMSLRLGVGVFFMPYVFAWFTLRQGYSRLARGLSFGWLALVVITNLSNLAGAPAADAPRPPAAAQTVTTPSPTPAPMRPARR